MKTTTQLEDDRHPLEGKKLFDKFQFENHLELMSLQLLPDELREFNQKYELEKKKDQKMQYLFPILGVAIAGSIVIVPSLIFTLSSIGKLVLFAMFMLSIPVLLRFTLIRNYPFLGALDYTWYKFLSDRGIEVERSFLNNSNLYLKVKSYIKKVVPKNVRYLSAMYSDGELAILENSNDEYVESLRTRIMHPIMWDWVFFENPQLKQKLQPVSRVLKLAYAIYGLIALITLGYIFLNLSNDPQQANQGLLFIYFVFIPIQFVIAIFVYRYKVRRQKVEYSPGVIREILSDRNISAPQNQLYVTLQKYIEENFPYVEI